eukprot:14791702-Alexandrium_andersonii.AAC.1
MPDSSKSSDEYVEAIASLTSDLNKMRSKGARSFIIAGDFNLQMPPDHYHFGPGSWGSLVADQH